MGIQVQAQTVKLAETSQSWDGSTLPAYPTGTPKVTVLKITISPKTQLDMHKHPIINVGVLTKGELTVVKESGETLKLQAGEAIVELVDAYHYGVNEGDSEAEIIVFYAGDENSPVSIKR
jgi:quercetin dioxygenase-like cupin family protein